MRVIARLTLDRVVENVFAETEQAAFRSAQVPENGDKRRIRAESFADHYSQARQFFRSQTPVEQEHITDAFVFELGKCEIPAIRTRMLANLRNVDESLASAVADGLGMPLPSPSPAAVAPHDDLPASPALLPSATGAEELAQRAAVKDFVSDAFTHHKFIGVVASADVLLAAAGVEPDDGVVTISDAGDADAFLDQCGAIRFWERDVRP